MFVLSGFDFKNMTRLLLMLRRRGETPGHHMEAIQPEHTSAPVHLPLLQQSGVGLTIQSQP
jgi:hypothetical protein